MAAMGGDLTQFVPQSVADALLAHFAEKS
ncbi:MAG: phosphopantetheine adenylyltransferase [Parvibaculaceae bacterium]